MSKILITGNGFDLFHHLPTKYGHFMSVMKTIEYNDFTKVVKFNDLFSKDFKVENSDDYQLIYDHYNCNEIEFDFSEILKIKNQLKTNSLFKHFSYVNDIETWIDFEIELENLLLQISKLISYSDSNITGSKYFKKNALNVYIDFSHFSIINNLNPETSEFEKDYINARTNKFDGTKVLRKFSELLNDFITIFELYLSKITEKFYDKFKGKIKIPIEEISIFKTFNYTPSIEKLYNLSKIQSYIHGKICNSNLVLGINELPDEIIKLKGFNFLKKYQKISKNISEKFIEIPNEKTYINEQTIFYIFGHSLDKSDKEYFKDLFLYIENDRSKKSQIIIFFINQSDKENKIKNLFSYIDNNYLVKCFEDNRIRFSEINQDNMDKEFKKTLWVHNFVT